MWFYISVASLVLVLGFGIRAYFKIKGELSPASTPADEVPKPRTARPKTKHDEDKEALSLYYRVVRLINSLWLVAIAILILYTGLKSYSNTTFKEWAWTAPWIIVSAMSVWMFAWYTKKSIRAIPENRLAMLLIFGRYVCNLPAGIVYVPYWISSVIHVSTEQNESDLPDSPEFIDHGDPNKRTGENGRIPEGFTPALRVMLAEKKADGPTFEIKYRVRKLDGTTEERILGVVPNRPSLLRGQTVEVEMSYAFIIEDLLTFYRKVGNVDNAKEIMDDHAIAGVSSELQRLCPVEVNFLSKEIAENLKFDLYDLTRDWGIRVTVVRMKPLGFSHEFNTAYMEAAKAFENKDKVITDAQGASEARVIMGRAEGTYEKELLTGRAEGQRELVDASLLDGGRALAIQTVGDALKTATLIATDPNNLLGAAVGAKTVIDQFRNPEQLITLTDGDKKTVKSPTPPERTPRPLGSRDTRKKGKRS